MEQVVECRIGSNTNSSVTAQMLVAVRDSSDRCIILIVGKNTERGDESVFQKLPIIIFFSEICT